MIGAVIALFLIVIFAVAASSSSDNGPTGQASSPAYQAAYLHGYHAGPTARYRFMGGHTAQEACNSEANWIGPPSGIPDQDNGWMAGCEDAANGQPSLFGG